MPLLAYSVLFTQTKGMIHEDRAIHTQRLRDSQDRLVKIKRLVEDKENARVELEGRIQALQLAVAAESEAQDTKRSEIEAMRTSRKARFLPRVSHYAPFGLKWRTLRTVPPLLWVDSSLLRFFHKTHTSDGDARNHDV